MNNITKNIIRTAVPAVVGALTSWLTHVWAKVPVADQTVIFPIATTVYYAAIRYAETKYPKLGWLLGALPVKPAAPVVTPPAK